MPPTSDSLNFTTRVDLSGLQSGMQQAAQTVQSGAQNIAQSMEAANEAVKDSVDAFSGFGDSAEAAFAQVEAQGLGVVETMRSIQQAAADQAKQLTDMAAAAAAEADAEVQANLSRIASMDAVSAAYRQLAIARTEDRQAQTQLSTAYKNYGSATDANAITVLAYAEREAAEAAEQLTLAKKNLADAMRFEQEAATSTIPSIEEAAASENELAAATERAGLSARMTATAGFGMLEGRMMSAGRAAAAFVSTTLGLGPILEVAFPVIGALALGEVLVDVTGKVAGLYDEFVNLRSIQNEVWKELTAGEQEAVNISNEHLRAMREQQVLAAESRGGKTGRAARGEEAGSNFDLAQTKNDLAIVNSQIEVFQQRVTDLQARMHPADAVYSSKGYRVGGQSDDEKLAAIDMPKAEQDLANAQAQRQNLQTQAANNQTQALLRQKEVAEDAGRSEEAATAKSLAANQAAARLIDEEAKKEEAEYKKLDEIKNRENEHARTIKPENDYPELEGYVNQQIKLNDAQNEAYEIAEKNASSMNEAQIRAKSATGAITPLAAAYAEAAEHARQFRQELADLNALLEQQQKNGNSVGAAVTQNQISQVKGRQGVSGVQDQATIASQFTQPYMQAFDSINNAWLQMQSKLILGTRNIGRAFAQMGAEMVVSIAASFEKMLIKSAEVELRLVLAHQLGNQQKVASDQISSTQSQVISTETGLKQVLIEAKKAAAGAWSALSDIPVVGPILGAAAAAATFAGVMALAAFDTGGIIPNTGVALVHQGEAVLPRNLTDMLMDRANNGSNGGGAGLTVNHTSTYIGNSNQVFRSMLDQNHQHVARAVQRAARQSGRTGRR